MFLILQQYYLHEKGYDEDSVPLPKSVLQRIKQRAVPVNQMELQQNKGLVWEAIVVNRCREQTSAGNDQELLCQVKLDRNRGSFKETKLLS